MIAVLSFYSGDLQQAVTFLEWCKKLGGCKNFNCLLVAEYSMTWDRAGDVFSAAKEVFRDVYLVQPPKPLKDESWPMGPNWQFQTACMHVMAKLHDSFLWLEPDCVPMRPGWLDEIASEYAACRKPFMGPFVSGNRANLPRVHLAGCSVYPRDAYKRLTPIWRFRNKAWDIVSHYLTIPYAKETKLIQHFWGKRDMPPTFVPGQPNSLRPGFINPETVLFHRCKDSTLIDALETRLAAQSNPTEVKRTEPTVKAVPESFESSKGFVVVLPFCNKDARLQIKNVQWHGELNRDRKYSCVLSYDDSTREVFVSSMKKLAEAAYMHVLEHCYPTPRSDKWPDVATSAFQETARYMKSIGKPWLWMESDMIPLKANWLEILQEEYSKCGRPMMGSRVDGMNHFNGTAIYPACFPDLSPATMNATSGAFDTIMASDTFHLTHNAGTLMQHCWGIIGSNASSTNGPPAVFRTSNDLKRWIKPKSVTFHRCKDGSLINVLRKMSKT